MLCIGLPLIWTGRRDVQSEGGRLAQD